MKTWKIAIVGCGAIAEGVYMAEMPRNEHAEVVACCDLKPDRVEVFQRKFGIPRGYTHIDQLLADGDFDIVLDTASIPNHYELNMQILGAGKHLYSQKPMGLTVQEADDMIAAAKAAGVKFSASPIHMLRPDIRRAAELIRDGAIGRVMWAAATAMHGGPEYFQFREVDPTWFFQPGAGALYDMGVHALTQITGLLGPAKRVSCMAAASQPKRTVRSGAHDGKPIKADELYDNYMVHLDFGGGRMGSVHAGFCAKGSKTPSLEIYGEEGTISFSGDSKNPINLYLDCPERAVRGWMSPQPQYTYKMDFFQCSCVADLIEAIEQDRPVGLPPEHARHVIDLMVNIEESARTSETRALSTTFEYPPVWL